MNLPKWTRIQSHTQFNLKKITFLRCSTSSHGSATPVRWSTRYFIQSSTKCSDKPSERYSCADTAEGLAGLPATDSAQPSALECGFSRPRRFPSGYEGSRGPKVSLLILRLRFDVYVLFPGENPLRIRWPSCASSLCHVRKISDLFNSIQVGFVFNFCWYINF